MRENLIAYLQQPDLDNYLALRTAVMSHEDFNPYSMDLDKLDALMDTGDFQGAVDKIQSVMMPSYLLNPGTHLYLGFASHKLGNEESAELESMIYALLLKGMELTGDGSHEKPMLVSRTSDEYDYLSAHNLTFKGQALIEKDGKNYDVLTTEERGDVWFDITEVMGCLKRQMNH